MRSAHIIAARAVIAGRVVETPMLSSRTAARVAAARSGRPLGAGSATDGEARLFLKAEHLQVTGSFKPRGAVNRVANLRASERRRGLICISAGNHAQAVAYSAATQGIQVTVVMPAGASRAKAAATAAYGAEVILHGADVGETFARMEQLRAQRDLVFVPPFDDPHVICGQGTVGLEILEQLPEVDVVVVGVGGGGLICGIAVALKGQRPGARVYGVEPAGSRALSLALEAGRVVPVRPESIADGLGAPFAGEWTLDLAGRHVDAMLTVSDPEIASAMRFGLERMKQLLEPAGAAALAAVLCGRVPYAEGDTVCVVVSGGNVDLDRLADLLALSPDAAA